MTGPVKEPTSLNDVMKLKLNDLRPEHLKFFPRMTGWFEPLLLLKLLTNVIVSKLFGQYADRRLIVAALDKEPLAQSIEATDIREDVTRPDGDIWIDYVADLGDGFDATYAIAYLLAQPDLAVSGHEGPLPRGNALIMGGDEVYPTASRDDYNTRLRRPYEMAWPDTREPGAPPVLALPGNHDWYDGLVIFLAMFCRSKSTKIGNWATRQKRSYFSARLNDNWYVWGIDIALVRDMDQPQADYFVEAAKAMNDGANIILCSAEPGWYEAEKEGDSFRTLGYAAQIADKAGKDLRIPVVLSGDSHHYARYIGAHCQFITSGGGGAFLHGTLELDEEIHINWLKDRNDTLKLANCYPSKDESVELLDEHSKFVSRNLKFSLLLGAFYFVFAFILTQSPRYDIAFFEYLTLLGAFWGYTAYQEDRFDKRTMAIAAVHGACHALVIYGLSYAAICVREYFPFLDWHWIVWAIALGVIAVPIGTAIGGWIFGQQLRITCKHFDKNHNDAFSAMKLDSHRQFLRMHIRGDQLTIFPICIDSVPDRSGWQKNANRSKASPSIFAPAASLGPRLIETPIVLSGARSVSASDMSASPDIAPKP